MATSNEILQDAMIRHQTFLLRYSGSVRNRMIEILDRTQEDISDKIRSKLAANAALTTRVEMRRLNALMESIAKIRSPAWKKANEVLEEEMVALSLAESVSIQNTVILALPVQIDVSMPSARMLRSIALARPFEGQILSEWAAGMEANDLRIMRNAIQLGMTAGEDMATIARRVTGSFAAQFADGTMQMTRNQIDSVVKTAVQHVANHSRTAWFMENSDIVELERFVATLDSRTTPQCRKEDGEQYPLGKGPIPPLHFRCRSLRIAALDGVLAGTRPAKPYVERELLAEWGDRNNLEIKVKSRSDLPHGTRGEYDKWARGRIREMVGPVPATTTYSSWMKSQSKAFQEDTLGVTKAKLFRDGGVTLDKFVNRNGDELTLAQLAKRERQGFIDAGLDPDRF
jgi:SPP1 gp7 family putative phage head morphogenesis protein